MAIGLKAMLSALGFGLPAGGIVFTARTRSSSGLAGLAVTIVAAVSPARKAAKVPPVAAMQDVAAGSTGYGSKERVMVGIGDPGPGGGRAVHRPVRHTSPAASWWSAPARCWCSSGYRCWAGPSRCRSAARRRAAAPAAGRHRELARQNAMRNPKRTAASASALMIGVGLVGFITILAASTTASVNSTIDRSFAGDIVIDSGGGLMGGVDPALARQLSKLPQVQAATGVAIGLAEVNGKVEQLSAVDPGAQLADLQRQPRPGLDRRPRP